MLKMIASKRFSRFACTHSIPNAQSKQYHYRVKSNTSYRLKVLNCRVNCQLLVTAEVLHKLFNGKFCTRYASLCRSSLM